MAILGRRLRLPSELSSVIPKRERVLAWGRGLDRSDGEPTMVAATIAALYAPGYTEPLLWGDILRANWDDPILEIAYQSDSETKPALLRITLDAPGSLPLAVRDRVQATILLAHHVALVGAAGARLIARRIPDSDEVRWTIVFDSSLDSDDPVLRHRVDVALAELRSNLGI